MPTRQRPRDGTVPHALAESETRPAESETHAAERAEELAHSLSLLRATLEATTDAILVADAQGRVTSYNEKFVEMWSLPRDVMESGDESRMLALALPQLKDPQQFLAKVEELYADPESASFDVLEFKDGRTFERYSNPQRIGDRGVGRVWSFRDISARKRAEAEVRFKTAFLEAQVNSSHDGILVVDEKGKKLVQNRRLVDMWKIPQDIADDSDDQKQVQFVMHRTRDPEQFAAKVIYLYSHPDETSHNEVELVDGTILDRYSYPIVGTDGTHYGRIWSFRDITERKRMEEQLRQAQKMEAVGRLAGGIAHDFNNILCVITGFTELLAREIVAPDPRLRRIDQIRRATERAVTLTTQLLAFSRKQVLQPQPLNLNAVVSEIEPMLGRLLGEDVQLEVVLGEDLMGILADPGQIGQVIMNLAVNARDAMPKGGRLVVETSNVEIDAFYSSHHPGVTPGPHVMLAVSDTGVGMDAGVRSHIFEPFFTTKPTGQGTGLGLATVHGIVTQSGGHILVQSETGSGTTFKIYLPRLEMKAAAFTAPVAASEARGGSETILLVEDEPSLRELTSEVLKDLGYNVLTAGSTAEALETAAGCAGLIDLLLTDVVMPGESGSELARRLLLLRPATRILYMSGYASDALVQHGVSEATAAFIAKPFAPIALAHKVRALLDS